MTPAGVERIDGWEARIKIGKLGMAAITWMFVSPQIICWNPNPQNDSIRSLRLLGGAEVMRVGPSWTGLVPYTWDPTEILSLPTVRGTHWEGASFKLERGSSPGPNQAAHSAWTSSLQNCDTCLSVVHELPSLWHFVIAAGMDWDKNDCHDLSKDMITGPGL